ncbi:RNA-binding S4 domain-containing protein [Chelatococcus daeguensis]|uniref:RNA-binding protein n=1 Tax=Chelatococcus daeguensis TaxID=444444 RepID=A0AAC9NXR1_9HYPH|nr:RNA-binding S4 domain-containing protein [Chelatococcus daeguensis]APF36338.1 RNA-binding protein [Chelatococcus daeguensis]KZE30663.1 RNA-binding protein [Chelatococcus daeguensis]MBM3082029.1 RNA-binding S4 domain-containing protein [Chelatococcus daeguensis]
MTEQEAERLRLDKWLWHARMAKSRTLAARLVTAGHVRLNGRRMEDPARRIGRGDVLTIALAHGTFVVTVMALGTRRGPAAEARTLYVENLQDGPAASE